MEEKARRRIEGLPKELSFEAREHAAKETFKTYCCCCSCRLPKENANGG